MDKRLKDKIKGTLIVPAGLSLVLVPFSMLIGWNLVTVILFWLILTPVLTIFLPRFVSDNTSHLLEALVGMAIFYALIIFMIYDHYKTDYFQLMMGSFVINVVMVSLLSRISTQAR